MMKKGIGYISIKMSQIILLELVLVFVILIKH